MTVNWSSDGARDARDAGLVLDMIRLVADRKDLNRTKILRDDIDYVWAKPRETKQGHRKRLRGTWWSPDAYAMRDRPRGKSEDGEVVGTTGEHVVPMRVVVAHALVLHDAGDLTPERLLTLLRLPMAVVTVSEDRRLRRQDMPPGWAFPTPQGDWGRSIWQRYIDAGLRVDLFRQMGPDGRLVGSAPTGF